MLWRWNTGEDLTSKAEAFRRTHERWLSRAIRSAMPVVRIPIRRVDAGGFDDLLSRPRGREAAGRWWRRALARLGDPD